MAAVLSGLAPGEVALEVREQRTGDVAFAILLLAEVVAAVEYPPLLKVGG
jgi:hypothetical protein